MRGQGHVRLNLPGGSIQRESGRPMTSAGASESKALEELYEFSLPALVLHDPLSESCTIDWKGDLNAHNKSSRRIIHQRTLCSC